jgi:acylphosphatase
MVVKRARILLKGKVQGVFFRDFAKQNANKLGIVGYAKNLRNGDLEIVAQGEGEKIDEFVRVCKSGPIFAKVEDVAVDFEGFDDESEYEFFDIRHA